MGNCKNNKSEKGVCVFGFVIFVLFGERKKKIQQMKYHEKKVFVRVKTCEYKMKKPKIKKKKSLAARKSGGGRETRKTREQQ
jgi:hypothetical protein